MQAHQLGQVDEQQTAQPTNAFAIKMTKASNCLQHPHPMRSSRFFAQKACPHQDLDLDCCISLPDASLFCLAAAHAFGAEDKILFDKTAIT
jgi:hypothetical protein